MYPMKIIIKMTITNSKFLYCLSHQGRFACRFTQRKKKKTSYIMVFHHIMKNILNINIPINILNNVLLSEWMISCTVPATGHFGFFPILYDYKQQSGNIFVHKCLGMYQGYFIQMGSWRRNYQVKGSAYLNLRLFKSPLKDYS